MRIPALRPALGTLLTIGVAIGPPRAATGTDYFPKDQVRPGMMGVGRTVFQGHVPEEFQVEILGLLKNGIGPGQDMILSRLHGKNVERTGVIAGMSGSPVLLEGKLLGAVSYRMGTFEKEAIAGITPIQDMLRIANLPGKTAPGSSTAFFDEWIDPGKRETAPPMLAVPGMTGALARIATPLVFAGFPESVIRQVAPVFQARGLEPMQGGGGTDAEGPAYPIEGGVPIAVPLVTGDLSLAATGTLTHVEGNRVWAFGHPFLGTGAVAFPMARAEILITYPSALGSFKISNSTSIMGTLRQDRLTAIQGELGAGPEMLPVSVTLESPTGNKKLSYRMVSDRSLTPLLLGITTQASLQRIIEYSAETTFRTETRIEVEGHPAAVYSTVNTDLGGPQAASSGDTAREVGALANLLYGNRFEEIRVRSVGIRVAAVPRSSLARVGDVSFSPAWVRPGEEVAVTATVQPFQGDAVLREFRVRVPPETPRGTLALTVAGARNLNAMEGSLFQQRFLGSSGLDSLIRMVNTLRREDSLFVQLSRRNPGAVVDGEVFPSLPVSVLFTLGSNRHSGEEYATADLPLIEVSQPTDFLIVGQRRATLQVR